MLNFVFLPIFSAIVGFLVIASRAERARGRAVALATVLVVVCGNNPSGLWQGAFGGAAIALILGHLVGDRIEPLRQRAWAAIAVWWVYLGVSAVFFAKSLPFRHSIVEVPVLILLAWTVTRMRADDFQVVWKTMAGLGVLEVVWGVRDALTRSSVWGYDAGPNLLPGMGSLPRVGGSLYHPIVYSMFLVLCLVIVWSNPLKMPQRLRLVLGVSYIAGIALSGSRSGFAAAAIAVAVHVLLTLDFTRWVRNLFALVVASIAGWMVLHKQVAEVWVKLQSSTSYTQRTSSLSGFRPLLERHGRDEWFGVGFGHQGLLYEQHLLYSANGSITVDNMLVYLLGTMGVIGVLLFLACGLWAWLSSDRLGRTLIVAVAAYFFSFDVLTWVNCSFLLTLVVALGVVGKALPAQAVEVADRAGGQDTDRLTATRAKEPSRAIPLGPRWPTG